MDAILAEGAYPGSVILIAGHDAALDDMRLRAIRVEQTGNAGHPIWEQLALPRAVGSRPLLCLGNTAPAKMMLRRGKVAVMIHDLSYRLFPEAYGRIYRVGHSALLPMLLRHASPIFTVSHTEHAILSGLVPARTGEIVVAPNGAWRGDMVADVPFDPRRLDGPIVYVGSFSRRKNFAGALDCAVRLAMRDGRRSLFVGAGGSFLSSVDTRIPDAAKPFIEFRGQIERLDELERIYRSAACLLFPSFYEASPMPPAEAFALGCPVIVSDIPSLRERCGHAAVYCQPDDIDDMMACVDVLTGNAAFAARQVAKGYARARELSWRKQAETVLAAMRAAFEPASVSGG